MCPAKRFAKAASWLHTLLRPPPFEEGMIPSEYIILINLPDFNYSTSPRVEFDASPWGGGAVLYVEDKCSEYFYLGWEVEDAVALDTVIGESSGQTAWELLTVLIALIVWGRRFRAQGLSLLGDNLAALHAALHLCGRKALAKINREISWRRCRLGWRYAAGHLPAELNLVADSLSRFYAPADNRMKFLNDQLKSGRLVSAPRPVDIWTIT